MLKFKTPEVEEEFHNPNKIDPRIQALGLALAKWVWYNFHKDVVVTDVARFTGPTTSPHFICQSNPRSRAIDVRCHNDYFTKGEIIEIRRFLAWWFPRSEQDALRKGNDEWAGPVRHHGEGNREHLHICVEPILQFRTVLGVKDADINS